MQASIWAPPTGTLGRIVEEARDRVRALEPHAGDLAKVASRIGARPPLRAALNTASVGVIAEIKRSSPSKGTINASISASAQAKAYAEGGAAAISVLTEPAHFQGDISDLRDVVATVSIPALRKDFHIDPLQILEAKAAGASAVLLIARALSPEDLIRLITDANRLEIETIVEVRDDSELDRAIDAGAAIIGVNNRNLETLEIDPRTMERLIPRIPRGIIAVAESGVQSRADVERAAGWGADAVLVGSMISASPDPAAAVKSLSGVPRSGGFRAR